MFAQVVPSGVSTPVILAIVAFPVLGSVAVAVVGHLTAKSARVSDNSAQLAAQEANKYAEALKASSETVSILRTEVTVLMDQRESDKARCDERVAGLKALLDEHLEAARDWSALQRDYEERLKRCEDTYGLSH